MSANEVDTILSNLKSSQFYGSLEIKFEAGRIVLLRKTETIKPLSENYRNSRGNYDESRQSNRTTNSYE